MATTYKVAGGDTLSAIAKKMGVKVSDISGYRSGNPNLIYPGEVLNINIPSISPTAVQPLSAAPGYKAPVISPTATVKPLSAAPEYKAPAPQPITQPIAKPIITTTDKPTVGVSQIDAGKTAISELTKMGVSSDINTIRSNWQKFGLDTKLGTWIGSATQWNAYSKYAKDELERTQKGITEVQAGVTSVAQQIAGGKFTPEGQRLPDEITDEPIPDVNLSDDDFGNIIGGIASGDIKIPEIEIAKEATELAKEDEKARATQALQQTQQILASQGMTFSGIRTEAEENLAAQSLRNLTGISLNLAKNIISAARAEEQRRQPTIREFDNALYAIYPDGRTMKLLEGTAQVEKATIGGKLYEKNPATGEWEVKIDAPDADMVSDIVGSAETGYSIVTYNQKTGEIKKTEAISGGVSPEDTITPGQWALADRYLSDPLFDFMDIPKSEMAGVSLALEDRAKILEVEFGTADEIGNKVTIAKKMGKRITLTDDEITTMVMDDYEKDEPFDEVIKSAGNSNLTPATITRMKSIANDIYYPPRETEEGGLLGRILPFISPNLYFPYIFR